jgi:dienelactone hydrolase
MALGAAALRKTASGQTASNAGVAAKYTGALDTFETKVNLPSFDPVDWTRRRYESMPRRLAFRATSRKQAEGWQKKLHAKLVELVGGFPAERVPLAPQTLEVKEYPKYRREKFIITTRPGVALLGYLLTPKERQGRHAAMICVPGHGRGVDDIVGIDDKGSDRTDKAGYQHDFAIQAVEHGMAAVAIEPMAFGCRRGPEARRRGLGNSSCQPTAGAALLFGETMAGWRVWDVMRVADWIETRQELDSKRIGCMGISGGGTVTLFSAALEPRIQVAYVSGYMNTFRDSVLSLSHCIDNYIPGILQWAEMYDIAGLIAPRPLFIESGDKDNIFPVAASRESYQNVRKIYEVFGAVDRVEQEVFSGEHSFHGVGGLKFAARHLQSS